MSSINASLKLQELPTHTTSIYVYVDNNGKLSGDIMMGCKLAQIESIQELCDLKVYYDGRKIAAWKAITNGAIKSYTEGTMVAIPCGKHDMDIFVDFTLGYCTRQGGIRINQGIRTIYDTCGVFPAKFKFPSGYEITRDINGGIQMNTTCGNISSTRSVSRGSATTLIVWLGPEQAVPRVGTCNDSMYRFPVPINGVKLISTIKVIDACDRKNKYPTPINAATKILKAAIESYRKGEVVYFRSIRADFEFMVNISSNTQSGYIHISDIVNNVEYEIRAQFPNNYII